MILAGHVFCILLQDSPGKFIAISIAMITIGRAAVEEASLHVCKEPLLAASTYSNVPDIFPRMLSNSLVSHLQILVLACFWASCI